MNTSPILSIIHTITTGTMQNFNGGNYGQGAKYTFRVNKPSTILSPNKTCIFVGFSIDENTLLLPYLRLMGMYTGGR